MTVISEIYISCRSHNPAEIDGEFKRIYVGRILFQPHFLYTHIYASRMLRCRAEADNRTVIARNLHEFYSRSGSREWHAFEETSVIRTRIYVSCITSDVINYVDTVRADRAAPGRDYRPRSAIMTRHYTRVRARFRFLRGFHIRIAEARMKPGKRIKRRHREKVWKKVRKYSFSFSLHLFAVNDEIENAFNEIEIARFVERADLSRCFLRGMAKGLPRYFRLHYIRTASYLARFYLFTFFFFLIPSDGTFFYPSNLFSICQSV